MNKQDIFPLYVGKCKVRCNIHKEDGLLTMVDKYGNIKYDRGLNEVKDIVSVASDCQLILKRISDMSYENWVELSGYVFDLKLVNETAITMRDLLCNGDGAVLSLKSMTKIMFWLIQNGYALSDEWFTNGIAVEEKTK